MPSHLFNAFPLARRPGSPRTAVRIALVAVLAMAPVAASAEPPVFRLEPDTLRADAEGQWRVRFVIENRSERGLYVDSLALEWRSLDREPGGPAATGVHSLVTIARAIQPASAGESTGMEWSSPADFDRGTLTFHLFAREGNDRKHALAASVVVAGSDLSDAYPSLMLAAGAGQAELIVVLPDSGARPAPGVLYLPPAGTRARSLLRWAHALVSRGQALALLSRPGSGRSTGPPDRAGAQSVAGATAALARLAREPGVDGRRLAIWGEADGATTALLTAASHPQLLGVVAQDASFDAWATYRALPDTARARFVREAGTDSAAWRARSPLIVAARIQAPVLVLHSTEPSAPPAEPARAFVEARGGRALPTESRIGAGEGGRPFARRDYVRVAHEFLTRRLRQP